MRFKAFCIIPHPGEIEVKPLVLCRECRHYCECIAKGALAEKRTRYWTAKPSDEQRKAVKWE